MGKRSEIAVFFEKNAITATVKIACRSRGCGFEKSTILNDDFAPLANAGGPYEINEGSSLTLNASASTDADFPVDTLTYRWDLDGDGIYDENVTGVNPTLTLTQLLALGLADGPHVRNVTVEVSDGTNISTAPTTVTVKNVAPTVNISPMTQSIQYSDLIDTVTFINRDTGAVIASAGFE